MNNTVLQLLQIFENETDSEHMLTKAEILQMLVDSGYGKIEEKQFYRKIEELRENGYDIEVRKGKQTRYFLRKNRLSKEEWIFLLVLILGNKDLSRKETKHIIDCLESMSVCLKSTDYAERYKDEVIVSKSRFNQLTNFREILNAIEANRSISFKQLIDEDTPIISDKKEIIPTSFGVRDNQIIVFGTQKNKTCEYFLREMLDVETI